MWLATVLFVVFIANKVNSLAAGAAFNVGGLNSALQAHSGLTKLTTHRPNSQRIMKEAELLMPGGVSSPVRAFKSVDSEPIVFDSVKGAHITDVDGHRYLDYVGSWGTAIVGHAHDEVLDVVRKTAAKGTSFGAPGALENELAKKVMRAVPSMEMVRFTSSGTEACMGAVRVARAFTGRSKIIKISGCYHGHADTFLKQAGSGVATLGYADSPGVPAAATADTLIAEYNNLESVRALFEQHPGQIAGIIVEPVVGNAGFITPAPGFLQGLRSLCNDAKAVLIFDEVMSGFRVSFGGAQDYYGVKPDMTTLGKIIGGGLPVGAYGGRREIMSLVAPAGPVYQAGTLSGNPLAMASGIKTLEILERVGAKLKRAHSQSAGQSSGNDAYDYLHLLSGRLVHGLKAQFREHYRGPPMALQGDYLNGMFGYFFNKKPGEFLKVLRELIMTSFLCLY
jgi:glutamate-1-semialdehyde 2,1-aminomutase